MRPNTLSAVRVSQAMRRQVIRLRKEAPLEAGIGAMIKYKINAQMLVDGQDRPAGVVSKTDLVLAYRHRGRRPTSASESCLSP